MARQGAALLLQTRPSLLDRRIILVLLLFLFSSFLYAPYTTFPLFISGVGDLGPLKLCCLRTTLRHPCFLFVAWPFHCDLVKKRLFGPCNYRLRHRLFCALSVFLAPPLLHQLCSLNWRKGKGHCQLSQKASFLPREIERVSSVTWLFLLKSKFAWIGTLKNEQWPINMVNPKSLFEGRMSDLDLCEVAKVNVSWGLVACI